METKPFYELKLNPITMWRDSRTFESIRESNIKSARVTRIKKAMKR